jgi:hypothetical protein
MNERDELPEQLQAHIDDYLDGLLDQAGMQELEGQLSADHDLREHFVRYVRLHTDLCLEARAHGAAEKALQRFDILSDARKAETDAPAVSAQRTGGRHRLLSRNVLGIAAGLLVALLAGYGLGAAESQFVRSAAPLTVFTPQTLRVPFTGPIDGTVRDGSGQGIGLTHRLPGTGKGLAEADGNLRLDGKNARLELTTTNSDLNTQYRLGRGEYVGTRLVDLGFTGAEDFAAKVTIPNIPALEAVGQFGLYAGSASNFNIRGGLIGEGAGNYTQFIVNNDSGKDTADVCKVGLLTTGTDLRLGLQRVRGRYSLTVENLTKGSTSTLTIRHPRFLDGKSDLYVGLFGANTQSEVRKTLIFKDFQVTVWKAVQASPD